MQVAAAWLSGRERARAGKGELCLGRGRKVAGAADEPRHPRRDRVEHLAGGVPRRDALVVGRECREVGIPILRQVAGQLLGNLAGGFGMLAAIGFERRLPRFAQRAAALADAVAKSLADPVRHQELRILRPAVGALGKAHFLFAERVAVGRGRVLLVRRAVADDAVDNDEGRTVFGAAKGLQCVDDPRPVVRVADPQDIPAIPFESALHVLAESEIGVAFDGDRVAVVDPAQIRQPKMSGQRGGFACHPFHEVTVAADHIDVVIEQNEIRPVVARRKPTRCDRHPDAVSAALPERTGRGLDAGGEAVFGMSGRDAVDRAELLDVIEADRRFVGDASALQTAHPRQMQQRIKQHRGMPGREHEAVAVGPKRIGGVVAQELLPQRVDDRGKRHRRSGMTGIRLLHGVDGQGANGIDAELIVGRFRLRSRGALVAQVGRSGFGGHGQPSHRRGTRDCPNS